eukprot:COSAG05_NODE_2259_length_3324_cov_9.708837_3_plen_105_part_00
MVSKAISADGLKHTLRWENISFIPDVYNPHTVLFMLETGPQNGWLAASHFSDFMHAFRAACMHVNGIFSQPASQSASQPGDRGRAEAHMQLPTHPIMLPVHGQL